MSDPNQLNDNAQAKIEATDRAKEKAETKSRGEAAGEFASHNERLTAEQRRLMHERKLGHQTVTPEEFGRPEIPGHIKGREPVALDKAKVTPQEQAIEVRQKSVDANYHRDIAAHIKNGDPIINDPDPTPYTDAPLSASWRPTEAPNINDFNMTAIFAMSRRCNEEANKFGVPNDLRDPFRHAYMSAYETYKYGHQSGQILGDWREVVETMGTAASIPAKGIDKSLQEFSENQVDFHNNHVGRRIGEWAKKAGLT